MKLLLVALLAHTVAFTTANEDVHTRGLKAAVVHKLQTPWRAKTPGTLYDVFKRASEKAIARHKGYYCFASSTRVRVSASSSAPLSSLAEGSPILTYLESDIDITNYVTPSNDDGVEPAVVAAWVEHDTSNMIEMIAVETDNAGSITITPNHYLWTTTSGSSVLRIAQSVVVGDTLATTEGFATVTAVSKVIAKGAMDPVIIVSDTMIGDMIVTEGGIIAPIYAKSSEVDLAPKYDRAIALAFMPVAREMEHMHKCLFAQDGFRTEFYSIMREYAKSHIVVGHDGYEINEGALSLALHPAAFIAHLKGHGSEYAKNVQKVCPELF